MTDIINKICIDFHGVLTDGKIQLASDGRTKYETVNVKDISAIRELIARGFEVYIVTSSTCPIIDAFAKKVGCIKITDRTKEGIFEPKSYVAIGDSSFDVRFLEDAILAFCPSDAEEVVKKLPEIRILDVKGGDGCIYELLKYLL
jgi:3-deoxy-D-manno-octulosonate 8-phosphate phosphatase (KDO 8-P phosphatase)